MTPQGLVVEAGMLCRENDEGDDGDFTGTSLQVVVQSGESLYEDIASLVTELIAPSSEEEQSLVQVEIDVAVEMTVDKIENLNNQINFLQFLPVTFYLLFVYLV